VGGIKGEYREPVIRTLLGKDTVATHLENGIRYKFDAAKIMFSSGNIEERLRMADLMCDGETVVDMFAGIGYFSIPLAVYQRPSKVIACELNPVAFRYLTENVALNQVSRIVKPVLGDNRDLAGEGIADRVIMGYVKTTHEHLPAAVRLLKSGGVIHYHETCPNELLPNRPVQRIQENVKGGRMEVIRMKEIKSYAPGVTHVVVDAKIFKPV
jgi:tRNA wybutosine-synthesizing protein 2